MQIDPAQIHLSPLQQAYIARQSERTGKPWPELLEQFIPASPEDVEAVESAYEVASRLGLIGGVQGEPTDLARNPEHLEGFGQ